MGDCGYCGVACCCPHCLLDFASIPKWHKASISKITILWSAALEADASATTNSTIGEQLQPGDILRVDKSVGNAAATFNFTVMEISA
jgi:hypothetical protein